MRIVLKQIIKIMENVFKNLMFFSQFITILGIGYMNKHMANNVEVIIKTDTVYIEKVVYKDTCDSQFMKAILEAECHYNTSPPTEKVIGDGGRSIGIFGMQHTYFKSCPLAEMLGYKYQDMHDQQKAAHVFWAVNGVYVAKFNKEHKRLPTFEELAMIHNAGYERSYRAVQYRKKFNRLFKQQFNGHSKED